MKIYKYVLTITGYQTVMMPRDAQILCVQMQRGVPCLWALVDEQLPEVGRVIQICGTGHDLPNGVGKFIGTFQPNDSLVFHAFEAI